MHMLGFALYETYIVRTLIRCDFVTRYAAIPCDCVLGHKLISVAFKLAPAIARLKFIYINLFIVANVF